MHKRNYTPLKRRVPTRHDRLLDTVRYELAVKDSILSAYRNGRQLSETDVALLFKSRRVLIAARSVGIC